MRTTQKVYKYMNSKDSKTPGTYRLLLNLSDKTNLKRSY